MEYFISPVKNVLTIKSIITVHYFEYSKNFVFEGETHNFWELVYVDRGEVTVTAGDRSFIPTAGTMIFHKPNEFHSIRANGTVAPNLVVISFDCRSRGMKAFEHKIYQVGNFERDLMAKIIREAKNAYFSPLDDPYLKKLERRKDSDYGSEQMVRIYLEQMLIHIVRAGKNAGQARRRLSTAATEKNEGLFLQSLQEYLLGNLYASLSLQDICRHFSISCSALKQLFRENKGTGVIAWYRKMKIDRAKMMIRDGTDTISHIAELLHFSSVHYFSRCFKKETGMSPTEYARSVKAAASIEARPSGK